MKHITLYRKYRPKTFEDVKGREEIITVLKNQISHNMLTHAYLFSGTRGTGKTSIAKIFAKAVNCLDATSESPCGICDVCKSMNDACIDIVEIDAASNNGVDNIRDLIAATDYLPTSGKYKVYIIDEVHMLSQGAYNALLKTLEEPPNHVIFILATTELSKIPVTIISRCQRFDFLPIDTQIIQDQIIEVSTKEGYKIDEKAANYLAVMADGSIRDSLSILDMIMAFSDDKIINIDKILKILHKDTYQPYHEILNFINFNDIIQINKIIESLLSTGKTIENLILEFSTYVKNVISVSVSKYFIDTMTVQEVECVDYDVEHFSLDRLFVIFNELVNLMERVKKAHNKKLQLDLAIMKILMPKNSSDNEYLMTRLELLEKEIEVIKTTPVKAKIDVEEINEKINTTEYEIKDVKKVPKDIKEIVENWYSVEWTKHKLDNFILSKDNYSINISSDKNILILTHTKLFEHMFIKYKSLIESILQEKFNVDIKINIQLLEIKNKKGIDLREINFPIEKE